jgi:hypothetical protein
LDENQEFHGRGVSVTKEDTVIVSNWMDGKKTGVCVRLNYKNELYRYKVRNDRGYKLLQSNYPKFQPV